MANEDNAAQLVAPKRAAKSSGGSMLRQALPALCLATLGILTAFALLGWQFVLQQGAATQATINQARHADYQTYFNSRLLHMRKDLQQAASSNLARSALTSPNSADLITNAQALQSSLAYALRVVIVPKGKAEVDLSADVPITFAGLDVIKRAHTQEFVGPEVSINPPGLIYNAAPITVDGTVAGVLFVVFGRAYWIEPLQQLGDAAIGQLSIEQKFEGLAAASVMQWGTSTPKGAPISGKLSVPHLSLVFQPANLSDTQGTGWMDLLAPLLLALVATLAAIGWAFARLGKKLQGDNDQLAANVIRLAKGRPASSQAYHLAPSQRTANYLAEQLAPRADAQDDPAEESQPVAAGVGEKSKAKRKASAAKANAKTGKEDDLGAGSLLDDDPDAGVEDLLAEFEDPDDEFLEVSNKPRKRAKPVVDDNYGIGVEEHDSASAADMGLTLDPDIFRAYDIRGVTTTNLTPQVVYWVGRAFAAEAKEHNMARAVIGRDGRHSSPDLAAALAKGLTEGGLDVLDIGLAPTPVLYYATHELKTGTGIMITGSHNPPEYNGLKMMLAGETLAEARILRLYQRIEQNELSEGAGEIQAVDINQSYLDRIIDDVALAQGKKVVVDCGNGVASNWAPALLQELGCDVVPLYCEVDGDFPNHHPDPAEPKNLEDLITVVDAEKADLGLAFDGDGDRLGVVTPKGKIIWPDTLIMLFSQDIISRNPGADIIYDVKCSRHLNHIISEAGGRPIMWKTGHSHIKAKMRETGALLGGEFSGHICFGERWYGFDDALYSAARLLEILGTDERNVDELFSQFPETFATPEIKIQTTDQEKFVIMDKLKRDGDFGDGAVTAIDGVRVDYNDSWGLIRPSNTSPVLSLRFEADSEAALKKVQAGFAKELKRIDPDLTFG